MAALALIIAIIALIVAYLAYTKSGGSTEELRSRVDDLGARTENLRQKTADMLGNLEKRVRGEYKAQEGKPSGETVEGEIVEEEKKEQEQ